MLQHKKISIIDYDLQIQDGQTGHRCNKKVVWDAYPESPHNRDDQNCCTYNTVFSAHEKRITARKQDSRISIKQPFQYTT